MNSMAYDRLLSKANKIKKNLPPISAALKFRREQYGLTQLEFSTLLGLRVSHYSEIENGKRNLPRWAMSRAYKIGVPAEVLLQ